VSELVYESHLKCDARKGLRVRIPPKAIFSLFCKSVHADFLVFVDEIDYVSMQQMIYYIREKFHPLHRLRRHKAIYDLLLSTCNWQLAWNLPGIPWKVYLFSLRNLSWIISSDVSEPSIVALFQAISKTFQPKVFFDIGANLGYYSWLLLSDSQEIQCYLFEPDPTNADCIRKTIKHAGLTAKLFQFAVSDENGEAEFAIDALSGATGTLEVENCRFNEIQYGSNAQIIHVKQVVLDELFFQEQLSAPDLIKIDVEGAEYKVLAGAQKLIEKCQPLLIIECLSEKTRDLLSWLQSLGYILMDADNATEYKPDSQMILAVPQKYDNKIPNLLAEWKNSQLFSKFRNSNIGVLL
jgi:FkbM family methyltransferase